jgi:cystathionine beta-lyase/cystathionine gamma-synthase
MLAHYEELDYVETVCGVSRYLVRLSIGLEDVEGIWQGISSALTAAAQAFEPSEARIIS